MKRIINFLDSIFIIMLLISLFVYLVYDLTNFVDFCSGDGGDTSSDDIASSQRNELDRLNELSDRNTRYLSDLEHERNLTIIQIRANSGTSEYAR